MMKILFVLTDINSFHSLPIHFGIAYIAAGLKVHGYEDVSALSVSSRDEYDSFLQEVRQRKPDIVAFTSAETQFQAVIELSQLIKDNHSCLVVCGGPFVTLYPECLRDAPALDGVFRGECEAAFADFVAAVEKGADHRGAANFSYLAEDGQTLVQNPLLPLETDLDRIGPPAHDVFDFQRVIDLYGGGAPFLFNRGCPFNCSFCSNHALAAVYGRSSNTTRRRSVESCIDEIESLGKRFSFRVVHIWDDLFTSHRTWLYEFLETYALRVGKPFMCTVRSNLCDDELFARLRQAGCYRVHMALESGNDYIRNSVMNRNISREQIRDSFAWARKHNIEVNASTIVGVPYETEEMVLETIELAAEVEADSVGANIFFPYHGTRLWEVCRREGLIDRECHYEASERRESVLALKDISKERLYDLHEHFEDLVRWKRGPRVYFKAKVRRMLAAVLPASVRRLIRRFLG